MKPVHVALQLAEALSPAQPATAAMILAWDGTAMAEDLVARRESVGRERRRG